MPSQHILDTLYHTLASRRNDKVELSYTASLYRKGREKIAQKVGEEATETIIAAIAEKRTGNREDIIDESADLLYHLLVLWADCDIKPEAIWEVLNKREGISGHEEKRSRTVSEY